MRESFVTNACWYSLELLPKYEGCPSKSWTFVIKRDCLLGIVWNLYDMLIYIYDTFSTNMGEITV